MILPDGKTWDDCYDGNWNDVIVPEAFAHPAKFSRFLVQRILEHARDEGWVKPSSIVVDPFGGVACGGIVAAYVGLQWIGVELEQRFVDLARKNFALHRRRWEAAGDPMPVILQGDSRQLSRVLAEADCVVSSPPFLAQQTGGGLAAAARGETSNYPVTVGLMRQTASKDGYQNQGTTPGQLGAMKPGEIDCVISSPPYSASLKGDGSQNETAAESHAKRSDPKQGGSLGQSQRTQGYGSAGNLGNLRSGDVDAVISSPPWENQEPSHAQGSNFVASKQVKGRTFTEAEYGNSAGQIGNSTGDTFWSAARIILQQCFQILHPGGHAIFVVKAFVRNKQIVDFPGQWRQVCESVGFKPVCEHLAMLVKETTEQTFYGPETKRKERKSFFRRLAEKKGSPRIDHETVQCFVKLG